MSNKLKYTFPGISENYIHSMSIILEVRESKGNLEVGKKKKKKKKIKKELALSHSLGAFDISNTKDLRTPSLPRQHPSPWTHLVLC